MELGAYLQLLRRWFWLIILASGSAGFASFATTRSQPPIYQASVTVQVGAFQDLPNPDPQAIARAQGLTDTYLVLAKTYPFLTSVASKLTFPITTDDLTLSFDLKLIPGTPFFNIIATNNSAERAVSIANTVAQELAEKTVATIEQRKSQIANIQKQIGGLTDQLDKDKQELTTIQQYLAKPDSTNDPVLVARQSELITRINQQQTTLAQFQTNLITLQNQNITNALTIIEPARIPESPVGSSAVRDALIAAVIGGLLSIGLVALLEQLNTTVKSAPEIQQLLNLPALGIIPPYGRGRAYKDKLITWLKPHSSAAEAFRALRVNLTYLQSRSKHNRYIVTSSKASPEKSSAVANLAVAFANSGRQVIVIDADMHQPAQHLIFNLPNASGLSTILQNGHSDKDEQVLLPDYITSDDETYTSYEHSSELIVLNTEQETVNTPFYSIPRELPINKTAVPRVHVITAGPVQSNPGDLLDTVKVKELVYYLANEKGYEVILIDAPPILEVSDSGTIASMINTPVILTVDAHRTQRADLVSAVERFAILSVSIVGVVLTQARGQTNKPSTHRQVGPKNVEYPSSELSETKEP